MKVIKNSPLAESLKVQVTFDGYYTSDQGTMDLRLRIDGPGALNLSMAETQQIIIEFKMENAEFLLERLEEALQGMHDFVLYNLCTTEVFKIEGSTGLNQGLLDPYYRGVNPQA